MRNIYLLIFNFSIFFSNSFSQIDSTYVPFPTDSVAWNETGISYPGSPSASSFNYFLYMVGDTATVDNKLYNIVYRSFDKPFASGGNIIGYLREENKIVYFKEHNILNPEEVYYNFNQSIGDTTWYPNYNSYSVLDSVDFVMLANGTYRRRYNYTSSFWEMKIIEGVGNIAKNTGGLLHPNVDFFFENANTINCVIKPNEVIFNNKNIADHNCYVLGLPIKELRKSDNLLYPNPFQNYIYFKEKILNSSINIYSISGKKVYQQKNFNSNEIDLSKLENGIYFLEIVGEKRYYQRIVKM